MTTNAGADPAVLTSAPTAPERPQRRRRRLDFADYLLPAFILLLGAGVGIAEPRFLAASNFVNLGSQIAPLLILAVGQALTIIGGGLDLSMAALMGLAGVTGIVLVPKVGVAGAIVLMLVVGALAGLVNGAIIAYLGTSPFIVTLGMASVAQALALIMSNGVPIYSVPQWLTQNIGFGTLGGIPVSVVIAAVVIVLAACLLRLTVLGRYIYALGSNYSAALKSGVDVRFHTMLVYGISGLASGVAAVVITSWIGAAQPTADAGLTLQAIAAVVLGGVALTGGSGGMMHVFYGVVILGMLSNAMNMLGISSYYQILAVGVVIIIAVILDRFRRKAASS